MQLDTRILGFHSDRFMGQSVHNCKGRGRCATNKYFQMGSKLSLIKSSITLAASAQPEGVDGNWSELLDYEKYALVKEFWELAHSYKDKRGSPIYMDDLDRMARKFLAFIFHFRRFDGKCHRQISYKFDLLYVRMLTEGLYFYLCEPGRPLASCSYELPSTSEVALLVLYLYNCPSGGHYIEDGDILYGKSFALASTDDQISSLYNLYMTIYPERSVGGGQPARENWVYYSSSEV